MIPIPKQFRGKSPKGAIEKALREQMLEQMNVHGLLYTTMSAGKCSLRYIFPYTAHKEKNDHLIRTFNTAAGALTEIEDEIYLGLQAEKNNLVALLSGAQHTIVDRKGKNPVIQDITQCNGLVCVAGKNTLTTLEGNPLIQGHYWEEKEFSIGLKNVFSIMPSRDKEGKFYFHALTGDDKHRIFSLEKEGEVREIAQFSVEHTRLTRTRHIAQEKFITTAYQTVLAINNEPIEGTEMILNNRYHALAVLATHKPLAKIVAASEHSPPIEYTINWETKKVVAEHELRQAQQGDHITSLCYIRSEEVHEWLLGNVQKG
ncbi:MAG TPA: hypothetical protein VJK03_00875 [Candidatus Nanoarchaeia archaeon]|nr:hypothetical protein [Candidatus Nanoarchaeia archaeon]